MLRGEGLSVPGAADRAIVLPGHFWAGEYTPGTPISPWWEADRCEQQVGNQPHPRWCLTRTPAV